LVKLEESGCIIRFQRQMQPPRIAGNGSKYYDDIDRLAADVAGVIKAHDEEFDSQDQVRGWLGETGIAYERTFTMALRQLEELGRVRRPRKDYWRDDLPLPGTWVPPRVHPLNR
jgi:hypothetical protein